MFKSTFINSFSLFTRIQYVDLRVYQKKLSISKLAFPSSLHLAFVVVLGHRPPHGYITSTYASRRVNETPSTLFQFFLLSCFGGFLYQKNPSLFFFFLLFSPPLGTSCKQNKQRRKAWTTVMVARCQPSYLCDV